MNQKIYIFDSPDGTGKTEIGKCLSSVYGIPYFKVTTEHDNWRKGTFIDALRFDQTYISQFLEQTGQSVIIDRAYPAEWVYSQVFGRKTDDAVLKRVDTTFARLGTTIVIPLRHSYKGSRVDEVIPEDKLQLIHDTYLKFAEWTACNTIQLYVDDFDNNLAKELKQIKIAELQIELGEKNIVRWRGSK